MNDFMISLVLIKQTFNYVKFWCNFLSHNKIAKFLLAWQKVNVSFDDFNYIGHKFKFRFIVVDSVEIGEVFREVLVDPYFNLPLLVDAYHVWEDFKVTSFLEHLWVPIQRHLNDV